MDDDEPEFEEILKALDIEVKCNALLRELDSVILKYSKLVPMRSIGFCLLVAGSNVVYSVEDKKIADNLINVQKVFGTFQDDEIREKYRSMQQEKNNE